MFAAPVTKKAKAAAPSKNTSPIYRAAPFGHRHNKSGTHPIMCRARGSQSQSFDAAVRPYYDQASVPTVFWNFAAIPVYSPSSAATSPAQTHPFSLPGAMSSPLEIGSANDPLEREADRAAHQVMQTPPMGASAAILRQVASPPTGGRGAPDTVHETLRSRGEPLDAATRQFFEPRFGRDLTSSARCTQDQRQNGPPGTSVRRLTPWVATWCSAQDRFVLGPKWDVGSLPTSLPMLSSRVGARCQSCSANSSTALGLQVRTQVMPTRWPV